MLKKTRDLMQKHAALLPPSSERDQCHGISNLHVVTDIATALLYDNWPRERAYRAAELMVDSGCATVETLPSTGDFNVEKFTFEDKSFLARFASKG